jgi:hypothetical protein
MIDILSPAYPVVGWVACDQGVTGRDAQIRVTVGQWHQRERYTATAQHLLTGLEGEGEATTPAEAVGWALANLREKVTRNAERICAASMGWGKV